MGNSKSVASNGMKTSKNSSSSKPANKSNSTKDISNTTGTNSAIDSDLNLGQNQRDARNTKVGYGNSGDDSVDQMSESEDQDFEQNDKKNFDR